MLLDVARLANPCIMCHAISIRGVQGVGVKSLPPGNSAVTCATKALDELVKCQLFRTPPGILVFS